MYELLGMTAVHFGARYAEAVKQAVCDSDRRVLEDATVLTPFLAAGQECFRQGAAGLVDDATMLYEKWPFDVTRVTRPVHFWQGSADTLVPEVINRTIADRTPGAVWHAVPGEGHFIAVSHASDILEQVARDLG